MGRLPVWVVAAVALGRWLYTRARLPWLDGQPATRVGSW